MDIETGLSRFEELLSQGRVDEAGQYLEETAAVSERGGDGLAEASCRNELTGFWRVCGQREKSYASAERALALLSENGLAGSIDYATVLLNYATAKSAFGESAEALPLYRRVEECYRELLPASDYRRASLYNNMAQALLRDGNTNEAAEYFEKSLEVTI